MSQSSRGEPSPAAPISRALDSPQGRRVFMKTVGSLALASGLASAAFSSPASGRTIRPARLRPGDTVGLVNPAGATFQSADVDVVKEIVAALGLKFKTGRHLLDRYGYLAGIDVDRAADINEMFRDTSVRAILAVRGGWGCNRILPLLDYDLMRDHPKIVVGFSDITSLLVACYARSGLVTFHGPVGISTWNAFSVDLFRRILFEGEAVTLKNPRSAGDSLVQTKDRVEKITPGKARGTLIGGNLSVLSAMVGSEFLPDFRDAILFLEDDREQIYRIDRMLTQLSLAGILKKIKGFVFGKCTNCDAGEGYGSLTLEEVLRDHIKPLGIPAWYGAMIGHIENKFTLPVGGEVEIDAEEGTIRMLEPGVV